MIGKYFYISLIDIIKKISAAKLNENLLNEYLFFIVARESLLQFHSQVTIFNYALRYKKQ